MKTFISKDFKRFQKISSQPLRLQIFLILLIIFFSRIENNCQVISRIIDESEDIQQYLPADISKAHKTHIQPQIDPRRILEQDKANGNQLQRFAYKYDVAYSTKDGTWTSDSGINYWSIGFKAPSAKSLSLLLEEVVLPDQAEMFIYSSDNKMIQGHITKHEIYNGIFASDVFENSKNIDVLIISRNSDDVSLKVTKIAQGLKLSTENRGWGDAGDCNYDVNCPIGSAWTLQRDAVAAVFIDMEFKCSGTLVNNDCDDLTPNFLTAFHCLKRNPNTDMSNWVFRFNWQSSIPTCPGNSGGSAPAAINWVTRTGASFRAAFGDNTLILLNGGQLGQNQSEASLALAGWDRLNTSISSAFGIHHPNGDAKKISLTSQVTSDEGSGLMFVNWSSGVTEKGSSGSALFNDSGKIVGASLREGVSVCGGVSGPDQYSMFKTFWIGAVNNNDSDKRASVWLGGTNPPTTLNGIRVPSISPAPSGSNPEYVCSSNKTFTLNNSIPGKSISWYVSNPQLFATSGGAAVSGNTVNAVLRAANSSVYGSAILTYTLSESGCSNTTFTRNIWVGPPAPPTLSPSGYQQLEMNQTKYILVTSYPGATNSNSICWSNSSNLSKTHITGLQNYFTRIGSGLAYGYATSTNVCGSGQNIINFYMNGNMKLTNTILGAGQNVDFYDVNDPLIFPISFKIWSINGTLVYSSILEKENKIKIPDNLPNGLFYIFFQNSEKQYKTLKVLIQN